MLADVPMRTTSAFPGLRHRLRQPSLRAYLIALVILAVVPVLVFSAGLVMVQARNERAAVDHRLRETTRALAVAMDREVDGWITTLQALAISRNFEEGALPRFHEQATRLLPTRRGWLAIVLIDGTGRQLVNTLQPAGARLPPAGDREAFMEVMRTRRPAVTGMVVSRLTGARVVVAAVPVLRGGVVTAVLVGVFDIDAVSAVLARHEVPASWTGVVVDQGGTVLARTAHGPAPGESVTEPLALRIADFDEGPFRDSLVSGVPLYGAISRAPLAGWSVVLGLPEATVQAGLVRGLGWTLAGGAVFLLLGSALAVLLGRRLSHGIQALADSAGALGQGDTFAPPAAPSVAEVARLGTSLSEAGTLLQ